MYTACRDSVAIGGTIVVMKKFPQFKDKKVLIFGLGLNDGGLGMVDFFIDQGAKITITDGKTAEQLEKTLAKIDTKGLSIVYKLGGHDEQDFREHDIIIRNPAIKPDNPYLEIARKAGKTIEMEMSLFYKLAPCKIIGISGTKGKSTTTTLTYLLLHKKFGNLAVLAGNIGKSAIRELPNLTDKHIVVLEMSSFQLDALREAQLSPNIGLLTNIYEDHLNWHKDLADYIDCKKTLFTFQKESDIAIFNIDDPRVSHIHEQMRTGKQISLTFSSNSATADYHRNEFEIFEKGEKLVDLNMLRIDGDHNYQNALGAIAIARQLGVTPQQIQEVLQEFTGVEGRQQFVREVGGVSFYNDTTATAMEAMLVALQRFGPKYTGKILMISGGMDKGMDYSPVFPLWEKYAKAIILLEGTASEKMAEGMKNSHVRVEKYFGDFAKAVATAYEIAEPGDMVILCPGAASFNMFINEFDRGEKYVNLVHQLK